MNQTLLCDALIIPIDFQKLFDLKLFKLSSIYCYNYVESPIDGISFLNLDIWRPLGHKMGITITIMYIVTLCTLYKAEDIITHPISLTRTLFQDSSLLQLFRRNWVWVVEIGEAKNISVSNVQIHYCFRKHFTPHTCKVKDIITPLRLKFHWQASGFGETCFRFQAERALSAQALSGHLEPSFRKDYTLHIYTTKDIIYYLQTSWTTNIPSQVSLTTASGFGEDCFRLQTKRALPSPAFK